MLFAPKALSSTVMTREQLSSDKDDAVKYGPCALGRKAIYIGGLYFNNVYYVPLQRVRRVYKRLAVSKGYYEGKIFGSIAYLVVVYDGGKERKCRFQDEEELNTMLNAFRKNTDIPIGKA